MPKGVSKCPTTSQNPLWLPSWLSSVCTSRKDPESERLPETTRKPIHHHKPETESHVAEQSSWVPLAACSPPGHPFPIKSLALSARVSSSHPNESWMWWPRARQCNQAAETYSWLCHFLAVWPSQYKPLFKEPLCASIPSPVTDGSYEDYASWYVQSVRVSAY